MSGPGSHTESASVVRGQRWKKRDSGAHMTLRVMAFAEHYAMVRYPHCAAWAIHENDLRSEFDLLSDSKETP